MPDAEAPAVQDQEKPGRTSWRMSPRGLGDVMGDAVGAIGGAAHYIGDAVGDAAEAVVDAGGIVTERTMAAADMAVAGAAAVGGAAMAGLRRRGPRKGFAEMAKLALENGKGAAGNDSRWDDYEKAWSYVTHPEREDKNLEHPIIFDHVEVATDGGLDEIGNKPELWYNTRPLTGLGMLLFFCVNPALLIYTNGNIIYQTMVLHQPRPVWANNYLITTWCLSSVSSGRWQAIQRHSLEVVLVAELGMLLVLLCKIWYQFFCIIFYRKFRRWHAFARFFFELFVTAGSFSGMKILYYLAPQVISRDFCYALFYVTKRRKRLVIWLVFSRAIMFVLGVDTFLTRYRMTREYVDAEEFDIINLVRVFIFLNQVLNAVEISWVIRERLFRFVFGGEDGVLTGREICRMEVWNARVAQKILQQYPRWKAVSILATWCDDDFQLLVLDEPAEEVEQRLEDAEARAKASAHSQDPDADPKKATGQVPDNEADRAAPQGGSSTSASGNQLAKEPNESPRSVGSGGGSATV